MSLIALHPLLVLRWKTDLGYFFMYFFSIASKGQSIWDYKRYLEFELGYFLPPPSPVRYATSVAEHNAIRW